MSDCEIQHELVCVEWVDAEQVSGWHDLEPDEPVWVMNTYGILVGKTEDWIILADTHLPPDTWGGINKIPVGTVERVTKIRSHVRCGCHKTVARNQNTGSSDEPPPNLSLDVQPSDGE